MVPKGQGEGNRRKAVLRSSSKVPAALVDRLAENPFWTIKRVAQRLGVAYTTAERAVERLEARGIVTQTTEAKRDRVYCATAILRILEEPANLRPSRTS